MEKKLIHIVIGILIVALILLHLNKMLIHKLQKQSNSNKNQVTENDLSNKETPKKSSKEVVYKYIKIVKEDMDIINKNWSIVKEYCNVKTWLTDDNETKIENSFKVIKSKWNEISKLKVPNNEDAKSLQQKLMDCKDVQTHSMSLATEAMNTSNFQLILESIDILIDSNKFITTEIEPLIAKIEKNYK